MTALTSTASFTTATEAFNIWRFATPNDSQLTASSTRLDHVGDSYDNALAETMFGLYKAELVRNKGPWRGLDVGVVATRAEY